MSKCLTHYEKPCLGLGKVHLDPHCKSDITPI